MVPVWDTYWFMKKLSLMVRLRNGNRPYLFNSERLQSVLIYHQFASAAVRTFANVITIPASTTGGQQGVIAEDRHPRRAGVKEGGPSSKKIFSLKNLLYLGPPLPETPLFGFWWKRKKVHHRDSEDKERKIRFRKNYCGNAMTAI